MDEIGCRQPESAEFSKCQSKGQMRIPGEWGEEIPRWNQAAANLNRRLGLSILFSGFQLRNGPLTGLRRRVKRECVRTVRHQAAQ